MAPPRGFIFLSHNGPDIVTDLHTAELERLPDRAGLQVDVFLGQCLKNLTLHLPTWMLSKSLHGIKVFCIHFLEETHRLPVGLALA